MNVDVYLIGGPGGSRTIRGRNYNPRSAPKRIKVPTSVMHGWENPQNRRCLAEYELVDNWPPRYKFLRLVNG